MNKKIWGWKTNKKTLNKRNLIINIWKGILLFLIGIIFLSFFSITNKIVYAKKTNNFNKINKYTNGIYFLELINTFRNKENYLNYRNIILIDKYLDNIINIAGYSKYAENIKKIYYDFRPYINDIFNILGQKEEKKYLLIFENSSEERPFGGFMGSFAKLTLSGGWIKDIKFYDSYYILYKLCKTYDKAGSGINPFENCDKKIWSEKNLDKFTNKFFPTTTFINSNIFGFTDKNGKEIIKHYKKAFDEKIDGVIFIKSDILKYIIPNGEKLLWDLEITNYKQLQKRKKGYLNKKYNTTNIIGVKGVKGKYLIKINNIIKNKKHLINNFILNYPKIKKNKIIRVYIPVISNNFKNFLEKNNFSISRNPKLLYIFFYNLGFNKSSKFTDHIIRINNKTYINKYTFKLRKGKNIVKIKNVFKENKEYIKYLKEKNIEYSSYLFSKDISKIKELLILPKNCLQESKKNKIYIINCK